MKKQTDSKSSENYEVELDELTCKQIMITSYSMAKSCAERELPDDFLVHRQQLYLPSHFSSTGSVGIGDEQMACEKFFKLTADELRKPKAIRYSCKQFGSVLVVNHCSTIYLQVSDVARISGISSENLHACINAKHFLKMSVCGMNDIDLDFVCWDQVLHYCLASSDGEMLIGLVEQMIRQDMLENPDCKTSGMPVELLYFFMPKNLDFGIWKYDFLCSYPQDPCSEWGGDPHALVVTLDSAKQFCLDNNNYYGALAYVMASEIEAYGATSFWQEMSVYLRMTHDTADNLDARIVHLFIKTEVSFGTWLYQMVEELQLVEGKDYVIQSENDARRGADFANVVTLDGELLLKPLGVCKIVMASSSDRGQWMKEYLSKVLAKGTEK